jgi:hypothetical protein
MTSSSYSLSPNRRRVLRKGLNELSNSTRSGTFTVADAVSRPASSLAVNGQSANLYTDSTFANSGFTLADGANTFTAIARDNYGRADTNTPTPYLPANNIFACDLNGKLRPRIQRAYNRVSAIGD